MTIINQGVHQDVQITVRLEQNGSRKVYVARSGDESFLASSPHTERDAMNLAKERINVAVKTNSSYLDVWREDSVRFFRRQARV